MFRASVWASCWLALAACACGGNAAHRAPELDEARPTRLCGEITNLPDQDELDQVSGCSEVGGFIIVESTDLRSLRGLQRVNGALRIYAPITSWEGLEDLEAVETLTLENVLAATLPPGLKSVGRLELQHNPELTELGVSGLAVAGINIVDNPKLTNLSGLELPSETDRVWLAYNPSLTDLSFLENVVAADNLTFIGMPMRDLDVLRNLRRAGTLNVGENPNLQSIDSLAALETLNMFDLYMNAVLLEAPAFSNIKTLNEVNVQDSPSLRAGPDFPEVERFQDIVIANNPMLERLDFAAATSVSDIYVGENAVLSELGFLAIQQVSDALRIVDNPRLPQSELTSLVAAMAPDAISAVHGNLSSE